MGKQNAGMIKSLLEIILRIIRIAFNADIAFYCQSSGIDKFSLCSLYVSMGSLAHERAFFPPFK